MALPASYEEVFQRFDNAGGKWVATWNWAAFVFGIFWYFYRGLWVKALIYLLGIFVIGVISGGLLSIPIWIAFGIVANYDLYLLQRKGTQLWDGSGISTDVVRGVKNTFSTPTSGTAEMRMTALENAKHQGVISDIEYAEKRAQIELDAEREKKLAALEDMRRSGMLSPMEYEAKKRDIMLEKSPSVTQENTVLTPR